MQPESATGQRHHPCDVTICICVELLCNASSLLMLLLQEYPAWWPNDYSTDDQSPRKDSQQKAARQPPQVSYAAQNMQPSSIPLRSNDLVTTQYLDVPSSGYPQRDAHKGKLQNGAGSTDEPCCSTTAAYPVQMEGNKENHAGAPSKQSLLDPASQPMLMNTGNCSTHADTQVVG